MTAASDALATAVKSGMAEDRAKFAGIDVETLRKKHGGDIFTVDYIAFVKRCTDFYLEYGELPFEVKQ